MKTTMRDKVCQLIGKYHALEEYFYNKAFLKASIGSDLAGFYSFYSKSVESEQADMCGQFLADLNKLLEEDEAPADPCKTAPAGKWCADSAAQAAESAAKGVRNNG